MGHIGLSSCQLPRKFIQQFLRSDPGRTDACTHGRTDGRTDGQTEPILRFHFVKKWSGIINKRFFRRNLWRLWSSSKDEGKIRSVESGIFHAGTPRVDIYLVAELKIAIKMVPSMRIWAAVGPRKRTHAHFMIAYATRLSLPTVKLFILKTKIINSNYA